MYPLEYSWILPTLAVGGKPPQGRGVALAGFDVLVFTAKQEQPPDTDYPGTLVVRRCGMVDRHPAEETTFQLAEGMAGLVAEDVRRGRRVLVTCAEGRNRSTLVAAIALRRLTGLSGKEAMSVVKIARPRNPYSRGLSFSNPSFNAYLLAKPSLRGQKRRPHLRP